MDLLGVIRACLRRWYVFLPLIGLTIWLCVQQYRAAAPEYTASTSFVVVPSTELIVSRAQQSEGLVFVITPFNGGTGASTLAVMLTGALNTTTVRDQLLPGGGVDLTAVRDPEVDPALVTATVVATDRVIAAEAITAMQQGTNGVLTDLQLATGAPIDQLYAAAPGGPVDPPVEDYPDRLRAVVAIGLAGTLVAVVLSVLAQSLMRSRRQRRERRAQAEQQVAAGPPAAVASRRTGRRVPRRGARVTAPGHPAEAPTLVSR